VELLRLGADRGQRGFRLGQVALQRRDRGHLGGQILAVGLHVGGLAFQRVGFGLEFAQPG
jgi:hypothetical protein